MKVCILEQISLGAMETFSVTQAPRSILPIGSANYKIVVKLIIVGDKIFKIKTDP